MLPRVSAALAQFISPIATSGNKSLSNRQGFERFTPPPPAEKKERSKGESSSQDPPPEGKVIPFVRKDAVTPTSGAPPVATGGVPTGISQALMQLMGMLSEQRATVLRWLGSGAYQNAARQQKKNGRARKGTILDEKAE